MDKLDGLVASYIEDRVLAPSGWRRFWPWSSTVGRITPSGAANI